MFEYSAVNYEHFIKEAELILETLGLGWSANIIAMIQLVMPCQGWMLEGNVMMSTASPIGESAHDFNLRPWID